MHLQPKRPPILTHLEQRESKLIWEEPSKTVASRLNVVNGSKAAAAMSMWGGLRAAPLPPGTRLH